MLQAPAKFSVASIFRVFFAYFGWSDLSRLAQVANLRRVPQKRVRREAKVV